MLSCPALGLARKPLCHETFLAAGCRVAMLARGEARLALLDSEISDAIAMPRDALSFPAEMRPFHESW